MIIIKKKENDGWYHVTDTLEQGALFNFIIGQRGVGKTYSALSHCLLENILDDSEFIYLRRFKEELKVKQSMFTAINADFGLDAEVKGNVVQFAKNKKKCGYVMALSTAKVQKSSDYSRVKYIIFDEFIIDQGFYRYLPDEVTYFLEFYETVARLRDVTVLFLSNAITHWNPYFTEFKLHDPYGKNWYKKGDLLVEYVANTAYAEKKKKTRFGKIIEGTKYADYAINNQFLRDDNNFLAKHTADSKNICTIKYQTNDIGIWHDYFKELIFFSNTFDPYNKNVFRVDTENMEPGDKIINNCRFSPILSLIINYYYLGRVFYENGKLKKYGMDIIQKIKK